MMLSQLQASLVAKLILVNQELINRNKSVTDLGKGLPDEEKTKLILNRHTEHLEEFNSYLETELARITGQKE